MKLYSKIFTAIIILLLLIAFLLNVDKTFVSNLGDDYYVISYRHLFLFLAQFVFLTLVIILLINKLKNQKNKT